MNHSHCSPLTCPESVKQPSSRLHHNYKLTAVFPGGRGTTWTLFVRHESANVSNSNVAYQDNVNVMKALVTKFPEVREAFSRRGCARGGYDRPGLWHVAGDERHQVSSGLTIGA